MKEGFPPAFYRLIVACLSRNPKDRYALLPPARLPCSFPLPLPFHIRVPVRFPSPIVQLTCGPMGILPAPRPTALQILSHEIFTTPPPVVRPLVPPPFLPGSVTHPDQDPLGYANALYVSRYLEGNSEHSSEEGGASDSDTFYS